MILHFAFFAIATRIPAGIPMTNVSIKIPIGSQRRLIDMNITIVYYKLKRR